MPRPTALSAARNRAAILEELRRLLPGTIGLRKAFSFGLDAIDSYLPEGGLTRGALHEIVPVTQDALVSALSFIVAFLARLSRAHPVIFVMPVQGLRSYGRPHGHLYGHGVNALGLDPAHLIQVETASRKETLWAVEEALRSGAPQAVIGAIDKLDLKTSQRLHLAATDSGLPLLLLRPPQNLESSAAATRWRIGTAEAARDRFGLFAHPRWHLQLERCRNGRPGEWIVEYDHVSHRFSLATALADPALSRGAGEKSVRQTRRA